MATLENFAITEATTGGDLMAALSEQEVSCVRAGIGEALYQLMQGTPITLMAAGDISQTAPLFGCLEEENVVYLSVAFLELQAGGWSEDTRSCITEVALTHPNAVFIRLGLDTGDEPVDPAVTLDYNLGIHECKSDEEKMAFTLGVWLALDSVSQATGADIFDLLTPEEAACITAALPAEALTAIVNATPLQAVTIGSAASHCISHETNVNIFVQGIQWSLGGTTDDTRACLDGFARDNPEYVELFTSGLDGIMAMPASEFVALTEVGNDQYDCMTEEEVLRVQLSVTAALADPDSAPAVTPEAPLPSATLETFVITGNTTGNDLMALLSEQEVSCVKSGVGDALYQLIQNTPITMMAAGDISQTAPLFNCLEEENVIYLAVAFLDLQAGGWDEESRSCITQVGLEHPDAVYIRLGLDLGEGPVDPKTTLDYNLGFFDCLSDEEKKQYTLAVWLALDSVSEATGADVFALLTDDEVACITAGLPAGLSAEQLAALVNATPLQAVTIGSAASGCISHETNVDIFVHGIQWSLGGTTDETRACLEGFAEANPEYVELFTSGLEGIFAMPADEFVRITAVGNDQYACMTEDEILRVQLSVTAALAAPPAQ